MDMPLRGQALNEAIREYIKDYILKQKLKPGDALPPEPQLMEELGVGRSSVREAVKWLQSLGIVEIRRGNGLYVRNVNFDPVLESLSYNMRFDPNMFAEVFQLRVWLESAAIENAVARISEESIETLEGILEEWAERIESGKAYADLDEEFHRVIFDSVSNQTLVKLFHVFWVAFESVDIDQIRSVDDRLILPQHERILAAIKAGDGVLARQRLIEHFDAIQGRIERGIENL